MEEAKWALLLGLVEASEPLEEQVMGSFLDALLTHGSIEPVLFPLMSGLEAAHGRKATDYAIDVIDRHGLLEDDERTLLRQCLCA